MKALLDILISSFIASCCAFAQSPVALKVESITAPRALDTVVPRVSWQLSEEARGTRQTAYQIVVTEGDASLCDSARVPARAVA